MILILSSELDHTTYEVIDWLSSLGRDFIRISKDTKVIFKELVINNDNIDFTIIVNEKHSLRFSDISSFWYRRDQIDFNAVVDKITNEDMKNHLFEEQFRLNEFIMFLIHSKSGIGSIFNKNINKLVCLNAAKNAGLKIPATYILTNKDKLQHLISTNKMITKCIQESPHYNANKIYYTTYTELINPDKLNNISDEFFPSMFQYKIEKRYELRIFYLMGKCYTMAIFSQRDEQTSIDFRKYNKENPNRTVPYKLPLNIEQKIIKFMKAISLNTGSIDMICTKNGEYYFLEVNPVGQFGMVSYPCNYYLEKKVAEELVKMNSQYEDV